MNINGINTEVTNSEVDELLNSGGVYTFYPSRELAQAVEWDMFFVLSAAEEHGVTVNWGEITHADIQELAALHRESGEHGATAWGAYGFGAYARKEAQESADRLLMVQVARINETVNGCLSEVV